MNQNRFGRNFIQAIKKKFEESINHFKKQLILNALQESGNSKAEAARMLKISQAYLFRLLSQLGMKEKIEK